MIHNSLVMWKRSVIGVRHTRERCTRTTFIADSSGWKDRRAWASDVALASIFPSRPLAIWARSDKYNLSRDFSCVDFSRWDPFKPVGYRREISREIGRPSEENLAGISMDPSRIASWRRIHVAETVPFRFILGKNRYREWRSGPACIRARADCDLRSQIARGTRDRMDALRNRSTWTYRLLLGRNV